MLFKLSSRAAWRYEIGNADNHRRVKRITEKNSKSYSKRDAGRARLSDTRELTWHMLKGEQSTAFFSNVLLFAERDCWRCESVEIVFQYKAYYEVRHIYTLTRKYKLPETARRAFFFVLHFMSIFDKPADKADEFLSYSTRLQYRKKTNFQSFFSL